MAKSKGVLRSKPGGRHPKHQGISRRGRGCARGLALPRPARVLGNCRCLPRYFDDDAGKARHRAARPRHGRMARQLGGGRRAGAPLHRRDASERRQRSAARRHTPRLRLRRRNGDPRRTRRAERDGLAFRSEGHEDAALGMKNGPGGLLCATRPADFRAPYLRDSRRPPFGVAAPRRGGDDGPKDSRLPLSSLQVRATGTLHGDYPPPAWAGTRFRPTMVGRRDRRVFN
jgi:hypothetical protein